MSSSDTVFKRIATFARKSMERYESPESESHIGQGVSAFEKVRNPELTHIPMPESDYTAPSSKSLHPKVVVRPHSRSLYQNKGISTDTGNKTGK